VQASSAVGDRRGVVIDFSTGATDYVMNSPDDLPPAAGRESVLSRFYDKIFASAAASDPHPLWPHRAVSRKRRISTAAPIGIIRRLL
jgi:hypothetical protein